MHVEFIKPGTSSNVYDLGFKFAIKFNRKPDGWDENIDRLTLTYGSPAKRNMYYNTHYGLMLRLPKTGADFKPRWFVGPKHWGASKQPSVLRRSEHWMVFKTEKDRTIASMMI